MQRITAALGLSLLAALPAEAFELAGATLTHEWRDVENGTRSTHFTGGVELSFGAGFGAQLGVKNTNFPGTPDFGSPGYELHLIWRPEVEGLALGLFHGKERFDPYDFTYNGIEARYEVAGFSGEVAVWDYKSAGIVDARHMLLELGYQINDRFDVYLGHTRRDYNPGGGAEATRTYLGGSAAIAQGFSVYGEYGEASHDGVAEKTGTVILGLRYDFGRGVTFGQRSYSEIVPED